MLCSSRLCNSLHFSHVCSSLFHMLFLFLLCMTWCNLCKGSYKLHFSVCPVQVCVLVKESAVVMSALVSNALRANNFPVRAINEIMKNSKTSHPTPSPEELVGQFFRMVDPSPHRSYVNLPYIKGITRTQTGQTEKCNL